MRGEGNFFEWYGMFPSLRIYIESDPRFLRWERVVRRAEVESLESLGLRHNLWFKRTVCPGLLTTLSCTHKSVEIKKEDMKQSRK